MKKSLLALIALFLVIGFTAYGCRRTEEVVEEEKPPVVEEENGTDAATYPTSRVGATADELHEGMSEAGAWVFGLTHDIETDRDIEVRGERWFGNEENGERGHARKIALYQGKSSEPTGFFTLTAPAIRAYAEGFRIYGADLGADGKSVVHADVYVYAKGAEFLNVDIDGDVIFASEEIKDSATFTNSEVRGEIRVEEE